MSSSDRALANLEKAAADVLGNANATLGGVGMACFGTGREQDEAMQKARAKVNSAKAIVGAVATFKQLHGSFS